MGSEHQYLVYSREHNAWWGPNRRGYFTDILSAGRYSYSEAAEIVESACTGRGDCNYGGPPEFMVEDSDSAYLAGAASRDEEVRRLKDALNEAYDELCRAAAASNPCDADAHRGRAMRILTSADTKPTDGSSPPKEGQGA